MSAIIIDNELVHYEVLGRGRPVILIHGWLGSWRYWIPAMQHLSLSNKYRIYALDLWGFGDSQKSSARYGLTSQVILLQQFMEKLGIEKAAIVGHALGAAIAIEFACRHPQAAPKVMLISAPLFSANAGALPPAPPGVSVKTSTGTVPAVSVPALAGTVTKTSTGTIPAASKPAPASTVPMTPAPTSAAPPTPVQVGAAPSTQPQPEPQSPQAAQPPTTQPPTPIPSSATPSTSALPATMPVKTSTDTMPVTAPPGTDAHTSDTLRRNPFLENPERLAQLHAAAAAAGVSLTAVAPPKPAEPPSHPMSVVNQPNPLADILTNVKPKTLLERQLVRGDDTLEKLRDEVEKTDEAALAESARSFAGVNLALSLSQLPMAVLMLHGQADPFLPPPDDDLLARIIAKKTIGAFVPLVVPDYRHFPMLEHPSQFNRLLIDFLDADLTNAQASVGLKETWRRQLR
jgi:pimeloyl-ACP methyl ester carboxylesterase